MGSYSAAQSICRVMDKHGDEIMDEYTAEIPESLRDSITGVALTNQNYSIEVEWQLKGGRTLTGPTLDIDTLAERYTDCDIAY